MIKCQKLSTQEVREWIDKGVGFFCVYGAIIWDYENVIICGKKGKFLTTRDQFTFNKIMVKPSEELLQLIGGL